MVKSMIFYIIFEINVAVSRSFWEVKDMFYFLSKSLLPEADTNKHS